MQLVVGLELKMLESLFNKFAGGVKMLESLFNKVAEGVKREH